jgi:hypothetical protein
VPWRARRCEASQRRTIGLVSLGFVARDAGIPSAWGASALILLLIAPGFIVLGRLYRGRADLRIAA